MKTRPVCVSERLDLPWNPLSTQSKSKVRTRPSEAGTAGDDEKRDVLSLESEERAGDRPADGGINSRTQRGALGGRGSRARGVNGLLRLTWPSPCRC